jgi:outer membrane protein assembly factor BamD (BamD/ComL family)
MFKKLFLIFVVVAIMAIAAIPMWTDKMAEDAFKNPEKQISSENVKQAIQTRMYIYMYPDAKKLAEKAIIYFPESKNLPYFVYIAARSSEKSNEYMAAIHWYGYFIELFPSHEWTAQVKNSYTKLKAMYAPKAEPSPKKVK